MCIYIYIYIYMYVCVYIYIYIYIYIGGAPGRGRESLQNVADVCFSGEVNKETTHMQALRFLTSMLK